MGSKIRNVDLNLLKVFDAVMSERNITRAAERLCVSQPAVSNALSRLRELHEDPLFIGNAKGVTPTGKAQEIAGAIREALMLIENTLMTDDGFRVETSQRKFTVALTDYGEFHFLPHLMHQLASVRGVDIVCLPEAGATLIQEMKSGAVDLVWDWVKVTDPGYHTELVFEDQTYCIVRKNHPAIGKTLDIETFMELGHVALRPTRTHIPMMERCLDDRNRERNVVVEVSHLLAMASIVSNTELIACLPERLALYYARLMNLDVYPNPIFEATVPVYQMWHKSLDNDLGHKWLRDTLRQVAQDH